MIPPRLGATSVTLAIAAAACGGSGGGTAGADGPVVIFNDAPEDHHGTALTHTLFLNTEGVDVKMGQEDDATLNTSKLAPGPVTLAPYLAATADRTTAIHDLVAEIQTVLAPYDIEVAMVRPGAGTYQEVVVTDSTAHDFGFPADAVLYALAPSGCTGLAAAMTFVFAEPGASLHVLATAAIATFGLVSEIPPVTKSGDCMCFASADCQPPTAACTIGGRDTPIDTDADPCTTATSIDESGAWLAAFGARPVE